MRRGIDMEHLDFVTPPLDARVFPPDHRNPTPPPRYNLVVIGAGTAGLVSAAGAAGLGARVALVERRALGGDCLNVGCVPSKTLLRAARAAADMRAAARLGVHADGVRVDFAAVMSRVRDVRYRISAHDSVERFTGLGVDVYLGDARFIDGERIEVEGAELRFARAVIATGGRPTLPPIDGLADVAPLTNETVFELRTQPARLLVVGAGPVGCELAQAFQRLGTEVTLVERDAQVLGKESPEAAQLVQEALAADGVTLRLATDVTRVTRRSTGITAELDAAGVVSQVEVDHVLVAAGRTPNVESLHLPAAGVAFTRTGVTVNDFLQTSNPNIYAAGDVCLPQQFTHAADASARLVIQNALFLGRKRASALTIPRCTYTDPEVAHVGVTSADDREGITPIDVAWREVDRAIADDDEVGYVRLFLRRGVVVGGTIVGHGAGDLIGEVAVLVAREVSASELAGIIHPYPTRAEAIRKVGDVHNRTRLTPTVQTLFERWLAWRR
jgi:pyruvate/2-oxoglutarate dehydrogenase complex dihydrolipoamide dehydrogenase (E3) component